MRQRRDNHTRRPRLSLHVTLPEGVTAAEWALERITWQNPRIRVLLAAIRGLEDVHESNYAILHCSPRRLQEIWSQVRGVTETLRSEVVPLLRGPSRIPALESARQAGEYGLGMLDRTVLQELDNHPEEIPDEASQDLRKLLCVAIGKLLDFLQDIFGNFMAADPRSQHDADYFLSRSFTRDVDEAEWLHESVARLEDRALRVDRERVILLRRPARGLADGGHLPEPAAWDLTESFLDGLVASLVPDIRRVRGLRGIRLDELDLLSHYAEDIPQLAHSIREVHDAAVAALARLAGGGDGQSTAAIEEVFAERMGRLMGQLDDLLCDFAAFVPIWRRNVEQRRALLLRERGGTHAARFTDGKD